MKRDVRGARRRASRHAARHAPADLHRADHLYRPRGAQGRHRELEAGACRRSRSGSLHHGDLADQSRNVFRERVLPLGRGVSGRARRGDERGISRHRRRRLPPADRRSAPDHALQSHARDDASRNAASSSRCGSRRSITRCAGIPEDRVRFHTCYSVNVAPRVHDLELRALCRPDAEDQGAGLFDRGRQSASRARMAGVARRSSCRPARSSFRAWSRTASIRSSIPSWWRSASSASPAWSAARTSSAATIAASRPAAAGDEVHPDVAWAKLAALSEGARIASRRLWA